MMTVLASVPGHPARRQAMGPQGPARTLRRHWGRCTLWEGDTRSKVSVTHCQLPSCRAVTDDQRGQVAGSSSHSKLDNPPVPRLSVAPWPPKL